MELLFVLVHLQTVELCLVACLFELTLENLLPFLEFLAQLELVNLHLTDFGLLFGAALVKFSVLGLKSLDLSL